MIGFALGYIGVLAVVTAVLRSDRPARSKQKIVLATTLPVPGILLAAGVCFAAYIARRPADPHEIDAGGMATVAIMFVSSATAPGAFVIGLITTLTVVTLMKDRNEPPADIFS